MSSHTFFSQYNGRAPVIFTGVDTGEDYIASANRLTKPEMRRRWGDAPVQVCTADGSGPRHRCRVTTLGEWIDQLDAARPKPGQQADEVHYLFNSDVPLHLVQPDLLERHPVPHVLQQLHEQGDVKCQVTQICVGQADAGLPFHYHRVVHGHEQVWGSKRWLLSKDMPTTGFNPRATSLDWATQHLHSAGREVYDCVVRPGEVIYVPDGWYHSTINIGEVVSIAYHCQEGDSSNTVPGEEPTPSNIQIRLARLNNSKAEVRLLRKGLAASPGHADMTFKLAMGLAGGGAGGVEEATQLMEDAVRSNPLHGGYHALLGRLMARDAAQSPSKLARAEHHLREAVKLDRNTFDYRFALAGVLTQLGKQDELHEVLTDTVLRAIELMEAGFSVERTAIALAAMQQATQELAKVQPTNANMVSSQMAAQYRAAVAEARKRGFPPSDNAAGEGEGDSHSEL